jgi:valyl-tRNA synthetase
MELPSRYNPLETENRWYAHWMKQNYFHSTPDEREPYSIVIPPPNVTGVLHMGHMLNNTIQDILIRKARMGGKNACWVPGTDHASIATEAKVVGMLRERGVKKSDITREEFLTYAWEWKEKYGGIILEQLKKLGCSCDWQRTRFTMEDSLSRAVIRVFVDLYRKGKIYRGLRMTNWDPEALTVLSNEEVVYREENSQFFYLRYQLEDQPGEGIVIATQRPETIMADTAIAVHPDDDRYRHWIGKRVLIPLINKPIPVIADAYVDREFGTGALKITPAHDQNDYEIGQRHGLAVVDILTEDGKLNDQAQILVGEDRFVARRKIKKMLEEAGCLVKLEDYKTSIGHSERTNSVVEPRLTRQWFLSMGDFSREARDAVRNGEVRFFPEGMWNMFNSWLREENVRDWCISRQLWWGQQIPAWYVRGDKSEATFVAETADEALDMAREAAGNPNLTLADLVQDSDVVDTWFSSWLWPISVFDGFERQDELAYYYPTSVLVTAWDIIFFWVARMIMAGYKWAPELLGLETVLQKGRQPFNDVYFTGMVRDNKRRKMSKSLGNSPDALQLIENYGADGVRYGILSCTSAGSDVIFDAPIDPVTGVVKNESKICETGRNFCNKMWNAFRLVNGWTQGDHAADPVHLLAVQWFGHRLNKATEEVHELFENYRLSDAILTLYKLIWDDFCSWYLEMLKPAQGEPISQEEYDRTIQFFEVQMRLLHPFMPFVTEEIYHQLRFRENGEDCIVAPYPVATEYDEDLIEKVERAKELISKVRELRNTNQLGAREAYPMYVESSTSAQALFGTPGLKEMVCKMANLSQLEFTQENMGGISFLSSTERYHLMAESAFNREEECAKIREELAYQQGFLTSVQKKLSNERFVTGAPADVVEREHKKMWDASERIRILQDSLQDLGCS